MSGRRLQSLLGASRYRRLERVADRRGVSVGTVVREAIDRELDGSALDPRRAGRRFLAVAPMPVGNLDELLAELNELRGRAG